MKARDLVWVLLMGAVVAVSFVAASRRSRSAEPGAPAEGSPVVVEPVQGSTLHRVTLSPRAAERLGIETMVMGEGPGSMTALASSATRTTGRMVVPYSAVLYGAGGGTWVYTSPEARVFVRQQVHVERIDGDRVILTDGPPAGTTFVTVGGAELLAAELDH